MLLVFVSLSWVIKSVWLKLIIMILCIRVKPWWECSLLMDVVANFRCVRAQRCEEIRMLPLAHPSIPPTCIIICYMNLNALLFYEPKYSQCLSSCGAIFFSWHYYLPEALPRVSWLLVFQTVFMLSVLSSETLFMATTLRILLPSMQREMSGSCILDTWNQFTLASWLYTSVLFHLHFKFLHNFLA